MRQRVAIAIAMLHRPDLIIADEPTTALDVTIQAQILSEGQKLAQQHGTSLIGITHDLSVVAGLADDVAVMYAGRIVEHGKVDDVLDRPQHPYTVGLIDSLPSNNPVSYTHLSSSDPGRSWRCGCPAACAVRAGPAGSGHGLSLIHI